MLISGTPPNTDQMDFVETCIPLGTTTATDAANQVTFIRLRVAAPITVSQVTVFIAAPSGNCDIGIYQSDGTTATKLASTGSTATAGVNTTQTIPLTASVTLVPRVDYYFAIVKDNATVTMSRLLVPGNPVGAFKNRVMRITSTFPLPASQSLAGMTSNGSVWWIAAS